MANEILLIQLERAKLLRQIMAERAELMELRSKLLDGETNIQQKVMSRLAGDTVLIAQTCRDILDISNGGLKPVINPQATNNHHPEAFNAPVPPPAAAAAFAPPTPAVDKAPLARLYRDLEGIRAIQQELDNDFDRLITNHRKAQALVFEKQQELYRMLVKN